MTPSLVSKPSISTRQLVRSARVRRGRRRGPRAVPADGVDLVHEDDAGACFLALLEQIAQRARRRRRRHLDEVGAEIRRTARWLRPRSPSRAASCPVPGRSDEQHALGDLAAELLELLRVLRKSMISRSSSFAYVDAGHVLEGHLVLLLGDQAARVPCRSRRLGAAPCSLAHEEDPDAPSGRQHRHPLEEMIAYDGFAVGGLHGDADALPQRSILIRSG